METRPERARLTSCMLAGCMFGIEFSILNTLGKHRRNNSRKMCSSDLKWRLVQRRNANTRRGSKVYGLFFVDLLAAFCTKVS